MENKYNSRLEMRNIIDQFNENIRDSFFEMHEKMRFIEDNIYKETQENSINVSTWSDILECEEYVELMKELTKKESDYYKELYSNYRRFIKRKEFKILKKMLAKKKDKERIEEFIQLYGQEKYDELMARKAMMRKKKK